MRDQLEKSIVMHGSAVRDEVKAPEVMKKKATVDCPPFNNVEC